MRMKTAILILVLVILAGVVFLKINDKAKENNSTQTVADTLTISDSRFMPTLTTISKNQAVIFKNEDSASYTIVTNQGGAPIVGKVLPGQSKRVVFRQLGSFHFEDQSQTEINVTVVVE